MYAPRRVARRFSLIMGAALMFATVGLGATAHVARAAVEANDEIHVDFGDSPGTSMWVHWHGPDATIDYGLTTDYGASATATAPPVTPVDIAGPFWRGQLPRPPPHTPHHPPRRPTRPRPPLKPA